MQLHAQAAPPLPFRFTPIQTHSISSTSGTGQGQGHGQTLPIQSLANGLQNQIVDWVKKNPHSSIRQNGFESGRANGVGSGGSEGGGGVSYARSSAYFMSDRGRMKMDVDVVFQSRLVGNQVRSYHLTSSPNGG